MKVGIQIDQKIDFASDSTFLLMQEAQRRGHQLFHYTPNKLVLDKNLPYALVKEVKITEDEFILGSQNLISLDSMDIILMRQDPPFDMRYITATYILDRCEKALVLNNPTGVRNFPEKLSARYSLPTLVTEDLRLIKKFQETHREIVIKPLYSHGGENVFCIKESDGNLQVILNLLKEKYNCPVMVQKFHSSILSGDKRVIMLDGKILDVFSRIPQDGEFRSNLCLNGAFAQSSLTSSERKNCEKIGEKLAKKGIVFAGIDLIAEHVIEINVTSPTGLLQINALYGKNVERDCWDCFENVRSRNI